MKKYLLMIVVLVLFCTIAISANAYNLSNYYPLQQGDTWTYFGVEDNYNWTERVIINGTEIINSTETVKMYYYYNDGYEYDALAMTSEGLKQYKFVGDGGIYFVTYSPPFLRFPAQMNIGDEHTFSASYIDYWQGEELIGTETFNLTLLGVENVAVPAGTFEALKFSYSGSWADEEGNGTEEGIMWFAYGVGIIKEIGNETDYDPDFEFTDFSMELINATVGGVSYPSLPTISGYVFDSNNKPLANFPVELEDGIIWLQNNTNENGYFEFSDLLQGFYELYINPGVEEESDCSVKNKVTQCYDITNKAVCENSYAEYCSDISNKYCDLPEGQCEHFPCFWGDVGEGREACYFMCGRCWFKMNQSISRNYTSIEFADEDMINLSDDLEINATLLKIDAKLKLNSSGYKNGDVIKANVTIKNNEVFNLINWGAVFGVWGSNGIGEEELYFNFTPTNLSAGQKKSYIFTYKILENNTYDELYLFGGTGNLNWSVKSSKGNLTALTYKVDEEDIHIGDSDGDGINDDVDNCPFHYNPKQGNITYAYDNFNDNILSPNWSVWKPDPNIAIREINNEIRIDGTTSQQGWSSLQYNQNFNQDVEASIRVRTPIINENSAFSLIIWRGGPEWGYYRIQRHYWGHNIGGHFEGQNYWDSGIWRNLFGDEGGNFHTYKIIYKQSKQNMSFYLDNIHLLTIQNVNFYDFRFEFGGEGWQPNQNMDFRIDNFTIKEIGDFDNDNVGDICDNCPYDYNPQQEDSDGDGIGNICEPVKISGYVFNTSNSPLNVTVELEDGSETMGLLKMTDKNGYFEFSNIPKGYYELEANDEPPFLWQYTMAGIGDDTPMLDANLDIQVNFTLWRVNLTIKTNISEYHNGDVIQVNISVKNNEIYNITNWEVGAELYFENETYYKPIDEDFYLANISSGKTRSFLVYLQIPENNTHTNLSLESFIWTDKAEFKSSKGLLQGGMGQGYEKEINVTTYDIDRDGVPDGEDNCPYDYNPGQEDSDLNGIGDICEKEIKLSGYVFDSNNKPLTNVPVELENKNYTLFLKNKTNSNGYFEFIKLPKDFYGLDINDEETVDCSLRNNITNCHDILNRIGCENSYARYCSEPGFPYCNLPEGQCAYFPCFWGEVDGVEGCYFSCDHCFFGINQSILENYTSIDFEDGNMINLTEDLEINATLLKIYAKLQLNSSIYKNGDVIKANVTVKNNENFGLINWAAAFEVYCEDEDEELYFNLTWTNLLAGQIKSFIFTYKIPENNTCNELYVFGGTGNNNSKVKSSQGNLTALIYKGDERDILLGKEKTKFNISLSKGWNLISIPLVLENSLLPAPLKSIEGNYSHGFTYIDGKWYSYYAGEPPSYKYIDPTMGIWVNMTNKDVLVVEGYESDSIEFDLNEDWNLIGYPRLNETNVSSFFDDINITIIYSYNGSWLSYVPNRPFNSLTKLKPGYGYWVKK